MKFYQLQNSFRDVNIAFANELSILCDKFEIDVWELTNRHPRVNVLQPGAGVSMVHQRNKYRMVNRKD